MRFLRKIKGCLSLSTALVIIWLGNIYAFNTHSHQTDNGNFITHSHPVNKHTDNPDPYKNHEHSEDEYFVLSQLTTFFFLQLVDNSIEEAKIECYEIFIDGFNQEFVDYKFLRITDLRAPPLS